MPGLKKVNCYREYGVRSRGVRVHGGGRGHAISDASPEQVSAFADLRDVMPRQTCGSMMTFHR